MKRQTPIRTKKETMPPAVRGLLPHAAVRATPEHDMPSNVLAKTRFGHDFSQVAVCPSAPIVSQDYSNGSCPLFPQRCPFGGACHTCPPRVQPKLTIGPVNDVYEQEADRVAEQVMHMQEPQVQRKECSSSDCKEEDKDKILQAKSVGSAGNVQAVDHPLIQSILSSPSQTLDTATRSFMEPRFRQDFSGVRVHADGQAAESAQAVNARAYTVGRDVVFGKGQYVPGTHEGKRLVAHELTHVVQQRHAPMIQRFIFGKDDAPAALPAGTTSHRGAVQNARWLQGHRNRGNPVSEAISYVFVGSSISSQTTEAIANRCNQNGGFSDRLLCLHDEVHAEVQILEASDGIPGDRDYVCRNYAATAHDVAQQMGLSPDWETSTTHAWVEFTDNGRQYVMDAYNQILFSYPI